MTNNGAPVFAVGDQQTLRVTIDAEKVSQVIAKAPKIAHFWLQGFLHRAFVLHRMEWLKRKGTKFGRGGTDGNKAIKVHRINEGPDTPKEEDVIYRVTPKEQKAKTVAEAVQGLREMSAEAFAGSIVLKVHEFGEDIRTSQFMAVPIKTRPKTPKKWLLANPGKKLEYRPTKLNGPSLPGLGGGGVLYEVTQVRGRGRPKKNGDMPALREKLRLRFVLTRFVEMDETLHMYDTWDQLASARDQLWRGAADKMHQQLQAGDPRDF